MILYVEHAVWPSLPFFHAQKLKCSITDYDFINDCSPPPRYRVIFFVNTHLLNDNVVKAMAFENLTFKNLGLHLWVFNYPVSLKIRPNLKISPSVIFQDARNISPTPKINPS